MNLLDRAKKVTELSGVMALLKAIGLQEAEVFPKQMQGDVKKDSRLHVTRLET